MSVIQWQPASVTMALNEVREHPAEVGLIGCCLLGGIDTFGEVANLTTKDVFTVEIYQQAFEIMSEMARNGSTIDCSTIMVSWFQKFATRCPEAIWLASDYAASAHNWPYYREVLLEDYGKREVVRTAAETINAANEGCKSFNELKAMLESVDLGIEIGACLEGQDPLRDAYRKSLREQLKKGGSLGGLSTGLRRFDFLTGGLPLGTMSVVAARPSEGKTALGLSILYNMCFELKIPCLFVSIEMRRDSILNRLASMATRIPARKIKNLDLTEGEKRSMKGFIDSLSHNPFWFAEAPGATIEEIDRLVRVATKRHQVACVFVDYVQKIRYVGPLKQRFEQIEDTSQKLQALSQRHGCHLCAMAQVNRKSAEENRALRASEISGSDQIEKDAEIVALLHRPKSADGFRGEEANIILSKIRDGEPGIVKVKFDGAHVQFVDPETNIKQENIPKQKELAV